MIDGLNDALTISWPMALGIALSPGPVLAIVLLLMTPQAKTSAPSFLSGWLLGILGVGTLVILLPGVVESWRTKRHYWNCQDNTWHPITNHNISNMEKKA